MAVRWPQTALIAILLCFTSSSNAQVPSGPCASVSAEVATLSACTTASGFCNAYLHSKVTAPSTLSTTTMITVDRPGPSQTVLATTTITSGTSTSTTVATATSYFVTTVATTTALSCGVERRGIDVTKATRQTSCGFATTAIPSAISAACNCLLKPVRTITKTATARGPATGVATTRFHTKTVPAEFTTSTSTSTLMLGTTTKYACVTPATPLCTPLPMQNLVANPSFESPPIPAGGSTNSTNNWVVNLPEPYPNQWVTFINNPSFAPDGSNYMSMVYNPRVGYSIDAYQTLQGSQPGPYVTVNFTYNVQMPYSDNIHDGSCSVGVGLNFNEVGYLNFYGPTNGWQTFVGTAAVSSANAVLDIQWNCAGYYNAFTNPDPSLIYGTINIDNVRIGVPDTSCAMNLEFFAPGIDVGYGYVAIAGPDTTQSPNNTLVANQTLASTYSLDQYGNLFAVSNGYPLGYWQQTSAAEGNGPILSTDLSTIIESGDNLLDCAIDPLQLLLTCSSFGGNDTFMYDQTDAYGNTVLYLADANQAGGQYSRTLRARYLK